jgi:hypothetical protein
MFNLSALQYVSTDWLRLKSHLFPSIYPTQKNSPTPSKKKSVLVNLIVMSLVFIYYSFMCQTQMNYYFILLCTLLMIQIISHCFVRSMNLMLSFQSKGKEHVSAKLGL